MSIYFVCMIHCDHPGCKAKRALLGKGDNGWPDGKGWVSRRERSWCPKHADQAPAKRSTAAKKSVVMTGLDDGP